MNGLDVEKLYTEMVNPNTINIDKVSTLEMIKMINEEDKRVPFAVEKAIGDIARAVDLISARLSKGGRLIYVGAGTSGRLGLLDASECPPTFGVDFEIVQGIMAGGESAFVEGIESAEDDIDLGKNEIMQINLSSKDVVCGIAASGKTPYVLGAMNYGREIGAAVICIVMNENSPMAEIADIPICVSVGPEAIMGSTRMKSGTAQKMILNMITTGTMIKLGKVYNNLMVDVQASNNKLIARAKNITMLATEESEETVTKVLEETNFNVKLSILMLKSGLNKESAQVLLNINEGYLEKALKAADKHAWA